MRETTRLLALAVEAKGVGNLVALLDGPQLCANRSRPVVRTCRSWKATVRQWIQPGANALSELHVMQEGWDRCGDRCPCLFLSKAVAALTDAGCNSRCDSDSLL